MRSIIRVLIVLCCNCISESLFIGVFLPPHHASEILDPKGGNDSMLSSRSPLVQQQKTHLHPPLPFTFISAEEGTILLPLPTPLSVSLGNEED